MEKSDIGWILYCADRTLRCFGSFIAYISVSKIVAIQGFLSLDNLVLEPVVSLIERI